MSSWLVVLALFFIAIVVVLLLNVFINISYLKIPGNHSIKVSILIFRRLKLYTLKISPADFLKEPAKSAPLSPENPKPSGDFESSTVKPKLKPYYNLNLIEKLLKSIHFEKMHFKIIYGFEDAALTGISAGILPALKIFFSALSNKYLKIASQPEFLIIPVYGQNRLEVKFNCILRIRVGNVIKIITSAYTH